MNLTLPSAGDAALPKPGEIVAGKYRIDALIGQGGMGVVLAALDTSLGRPVAVKFLAPAKADRDGAIQRFIREARAAASLQSEHVVRVFEVGALPSGAPFIVMELLRGTDLAHMVHARGGLPVEEAVDYLLQACEALGEAHLRGIVHRDLKPSNMFVTQRPDGSPAIKILDFGISKAVDDAAPNLTSTDMVMGTPLYMSPEQVRSLKNVDHRADIWALGSILFELLTARPIYEAPSASALCAMVAMDPPIPLRARMPHAPPELEAIILRCLHKDPNGRFQDVAALAGALMPFASERGRQSALRVSRVVRSGGSSLALAGSAPGVDTTVDVSRASANVGQLGPSGYPPPPQILPTALPGAQVASAFPPGVRPPSTQQTWRQTGDQAPAKSPAVFALLGALAALLVLAVAVVGGGYYYTTRLPGAAGSAAASATASAAVGAPALASATAARTASATAADATGAATSTAAPAHVKPTAANKDAGAPPPAVAPDAGAPPAPKPSGRSPEEIARLRQIANDRCSFGRQRLSRNDPSNNAAAKTLKVEFCLSAQSLSPTSGAAQCDRAVCREVCAVLRDDVCRMQVDQADRNNPLPY